MAKTSAGGRVGDGLVSVTAATERLHCVARTAELVQRLDRVVAVLRPAVDVWIERRAQLAE